VDGDRWSCRKVRPGVQGWTFLGWVPLPPPDAAGGSWRGMPGNFATVLPFLDEATRSELFSLPPNIRRAIRSARVSSRASRVITFYIR
jgi:hypothetical protein